MTSNITVRQWSFCESCKGRGCPQCKQKGTTSMLIPLESLPKGIRYEYNIVQKDFIKSQREKSIIQGGDQCADRSFREPNTGD